jgi:rhodanese-related sulfurtransferase
VPTLHSRPMVADALLTPPVARLLRLNFLANIRRDAAGTATVAAEFVVEQGRMVRILDVRDESDLHGRLGHIPSVTHVPLQRISEVPGVLAADTCIVVVSNHGARAALAARFLEELGMSHVAAMSGGMHVYKQLGFATHRQPRSYRRVLGELADGLGRDGKPLVVAAAGTHLNVEQLTNHISHGTSVRWVKLAAFLLHGKRSCVDGRDDHGVIGTPGGDAGEMLLGLAAAEQLHGTMLTDDDVERALERHLDAFGRFYMHSDTHAMNRLIVDGLRKDERIAPHIRHLDLPLEWRAWMQKPPEHLREALLEHLVQPSVMGCGHLRLAMTVADYQVRPGLCASLLRAVHRLRFAGAAEIEWVVLGGDHHEGAVVNVVLSRELHGYTKVPLISPSVDGVQMFVHHPQVIHKVRAETAALLTEAGIARSDKALHQAMTTMGEQQLGHTLAQLAKRLPVFEVAFADEHTATVTSLGHIS